MTEDKSKTDTTKTKLKTTQKKANNTKHSKTKPARFRCFLRHSARKRGGLILQCTEAHTGQQYQQPTTQLQLMGISLHDHRETNEQTVDHQRLQSF